MIRGTVVPLALGAAALLAGLLVHQATRSLDKSLLSERPTLRRLKRSILDSGDLAPLHHELYRKVGEARWERDVKPRVMREFVLRTALDQNTLLPDASDVLQWVRVHPDEAESVLREIR